MVNLLRRAAFLLLLSVAAAQAQDAAPPTPGPNSWAAHGAAPLKSIETIEIAATPDSVWAVISDFAGYNWLPGVAQVEASGDHTPEKTRRRLIMTNGGVVDETLIRWDPERKTLAFHRDHDDVKRLPAINYMTHVTVKPGPEGRSVVEWKGRFYRGHPFNDPPPGLDDDTALAAVTALHRASLAALKKKIESGASSR